MTKIPLKIICDQLTEALGLDSHHKVSALIDEENNNELCGWVVVRLFDNGTMESSGEKVKTIKELFEHKKQPVNCPRYHEGYGCEISPLKSCHSCEDNPDSIY